VKAARLVLFYTFSFVCLFLAAVLIRYIQLRIDAVRVLPLGPETMLTELMLAGRWAIAFTVYVSLLLALAYTARRNAEYRAAGNGSLSAFVSIFMLIILASGLTLAASVGTARLGNILPARDIGKPLGNPGLMLTRQDTTMVLLQGPGEIKGPRLVSIPGRSLVYQETPRGPNNTMPGLPPVPFNDEAPWFLQSLAIDFSLTGQIFENRLLEGLVPFLIYTVSLIFFLTSLGFVLNLSGWPLANLFIGALVFRGILALETFINSREVQKIFLDFIGGRFPLDLAVPLIFCAFGVLVNLYTLLVYLARRRIYEEDK
jgi:hypothetical protein